MTAGFDPASDVQAPVGTIAWTASRGWLDSTEDVQTALDDGDQPWLVDSDGIVRNVAGVASIALVMLVDKRITGLRRTAEEADREIARRAAEIGARLSEHGDRTEAVARELTELYERLTQLAETAVDVLAAGGGS